MHHILRSSLLGALLLVLLASTAQAATVSVRVSAVGPTSLPRTTVTMPTAGVPEDGHACAATTAGAALDTAAGHANWAAHWDSTYNTHVLDSIYGESHPFGSHLFWSVYVNGISALSGLCDVTVSQGDYAQFVALCDPYDPPTDGSPCYGEPLQLKAPATAAPGSTPTFTVTESQTDIKNGVTTIVPSAGAVISAAGQQATTDTAGHAALTLADRGPVTITATKGTRVDDSAVACVSDGADGFCGTTKPGDPPAPPALPCVHNGDDGLCGTTDHRSTYGFVKSIREQQRFKHGKGPRQLGGTTDPDPSGLKDVRLRLTRNDRGRCATFDSRKLRFTAMKRCGASRGTWFSAGSRADWTYLLPAALGRGRYVLDVRTVDGAANADTKLDRGRNRVVFFVA
jgi:hypothetical protein